MANRADVDCAFVGRNFRQGLGDGRRTIRLRAARALGRHLCDLGRRNGHVWRGAAGGLVCGLGVSRLAYRGFRIAQKAPDDFGRVLAAGITFWLVLQAFVNIGVVTQLIPFTGQPLPFISYGGSSLVMSLASVGILLSISRAMPKPPVVKSVPAVGAAASSVKENLATTKKNATR
ncbi:MAG: hypothetical protein DCC52_13990, partial [Chloroflexi bacterium]